ncbi:hypothetical protein TREVI0001_1419 [Treponema vincentii ATCC 35580]|uniref:HXXEE domain-containing protein n=2 Tax=Treponema vincentii TaxID=69710 RepID=C8PPV8_9SPIR|nr:hypothetical protein TREVI0001_1419 [Treponema vincentii ATCC 35580]
MRNMFWLFPVIFMLHEMEEIIGFRIWLDKNRDIVSKYNKLSILYQNFSNEGFSIAVLEEYLLCIIITCIRFFSKHTSFGLVLLLLFSLHLLVHILQSIIIKRYIPALASSIILLPISIFLISKAIYTFEYTSFSILISPVVCIMTMLFNLIFVHKIMKKVTEKIKKQISSCSKNYAKTKHSLKFDSRTKYQFSLYAKLWSTQVQSRNWNLEKGTGMEESGC